MKLIKSFILLFAILSIGIITSCTTDNDEGNIPSVYQIETPSNFRVTKYEDGYVLFFNGDVNAKDFRVTFFKDGSYYERYTMNQTDLLVGLFLEGFPTGTYNVKVIANANPETTDLSSSESTGFEFIIGDESGNLDPNPGNKYTVKFNTNGGTSIVSQSVSKGGYAQKPSNPTKTGYTFVEWQLNGKSFSFSTPINSNITLDAIWKVSTGGGTQPDDGLTNLSNYYKSAENKSGAELKSTLRTIITKITHKTTYDDLRTYLPKTDVDPKNNNNIILFYGHVSVNNATSNWNREHVWPRSLSWFDKSGAGSDVHHLRPENEIVNSTRGNKKMGEVTSGTAVKYSNGTIAGYYSGNYFEPNDVSKGDVARILLYMLVMYSQTDSSYTITKTAQSLEMLISWHLQDPVDDLERVRNERAYGYQGNRNPFIDYPEFVELIWG